jgi:putative NADH-flavin reductase
MARISILGGTGYTGNALVTEALRRGHQVTSVSRHEPEERLDGATYLIGSALEPDVLARAVEDHDVVIEAVSPRGDMAGKEEGLVGQLIELTSRTGTRLGVIGGASSLLVEEGGPRLYDVTVDDLPAEVRPEIDTGIALLETLKNTSADVDWFYVSPPEKFGSWVPAPDTGEYRLGEDVLLRDASGKSTISAADLARAVLDEIEVPKYRRRRFHAAH